MSASCPMTGNWFLLADLPSTGKTAVASGGAKQPAAAAAVASGGMSDADADLEARLENLRRQ